MFFNEFFSSEFAMIHIKHGSKRIEIFRKVKPSFVLVTRAAWGDMKNRARHLGLEFNTMNNGYYESGFELNQIYKGFGLTAFYRYGPYQLPKTEDNLAIKLSFVLNLGF
jgi:5-methylcytosine-specific restriction endonuclease McrBC GTP-binding regulatory subunit McrB